MNTEIRQMIRDAGLRQWQVAQACGVTEGTFIVWLRKELPAERRTMILAAIDSLSQKNDRQ